MTSEQEEKVRSFMRDLKALLALHGAKISGCGCCWSPHLEFADFDASTLIASGTHAECEYHLPNVGWGKLSA